MHMKTPKSRLTHLGPFAEQSAHSWLSGRLRIALNRRSWTFSDTNYLFINNLFVFIKIIKFLF